MLITRKIYLNPKYLNGDILISLLNELKKKTKGECTSEHGYILKIHKITRIIDGFNISSINCDVVCNVEFDADVLKPKVEDIYEGKVCVILQRAGILINVGECLKILVKSSSLKDYVYDSTNNSYAHIRGEKTNIVIGDTIRVRLTGVKYTEHKFSCFGEYTD